MVIGEGGDLREVSDDEHLMARSECLQAQADLNGGLAANAGVDLIEDQCRQTIGVGSDRFDREHHSREFAA